MSVTGGGLAVIFKRALDWLHKNQEIIDNFPSTTQDKPKPQENKDETNPSESPDKDKTESKNKDHSEFLTNIIPELRTAFYSNVDKGSKILSKNPLEMTNEEMMKEKMFINSNPYHSKKDALNKHIDAYFNARYPGEAKYDAIGRMIDAQ